ncbi:hypothetical protein BLNAU_17098 [Blattamonas nauphoetae]|uniref:Uncharacterized protein n=1 Tax=Blattamonas nauphoetae TaxID=2049346 RepID=A0ABQ9X7S8_9EUKA|nr:hypothetical protein BLNAU_17098 [Blattamonas nauphoetae]
MFLNVIIQSSQFVTFLISNRFVLNENLSRLFMLLLVIILLVGQYHLPTLEFVLASPFVMALSSCLSFIEYCSPLWRTLDEIKASLEGWKEEDPEVVQSGKRLFQALFSESFEDTLEQLLLYNKDEATALHIVRHICSNLYLLGSNVDDVEQ